MIITLLLNFIADFIQMLTSIIPNVGVKDIPFIGQSIAYYLALAVGYLNTGIGILPFGEIVWHSLLYVILPFEFMLITLKVFFGSRTPHN